LSSCANAFSLLTQIWQKKKEEEKMGNYQSQAGLDEPADITGVVLTSTPHGAAQPQVFAHRWDTLCKADLARLAVGNIMNGDNSPLTQIYRNANLERDPLGPRRRALIQLAVLFELRDQQKRNPGHEIRSYEVQVEGGDAVVTEFEALLKGVKKVTFWKFVRSSAAIGAGVGAAAGAVVGGAIGGVVGGGVLSLPAGIAAGAALAAIGAIGGGFVGTIIGVIVGGLRCYFKFRDMPYKPSDGTNGGRLATMPGRFLPTRGKIVAPDDDSYVLGSLISTLKRVDADGAEAV